MSEEYKVYDTQLGKFKLKYHDLVSSQLIVIKTWEPELIPVFDTYLTKSSNVVEVGSYIGDHTVYISKLSQRVFAFEPQELIYKQLLENLDLNGCTNVETFNVAVGDGSKIRPQDHTKDPLCEDPGENQAGFRYILDSEGDAVTYRLDDMIDIEVPIHMVKTDAEGMDLFVLQSAIKMITRYHPIIIFEFHEDKAYLNGHTYDDYVKFLTGLGYGITKLSRWNYLAT